MWRLLFLGPTSKLRPRYFRQTVPRVPSYGMAKHQEKHEQSTPSACYCCHLVDWPRRAAYASAMFRVTPVSVRTVLVALACAVGAPFAHAAPEGNDAIARLLMDKGVIEVRDATSGL